MEGFISEDIPPSASSPLDDQSLESELLPSLPSPWPLPSLAFGRDLLSVSNLEESLKSGREKSSCPFSFESKVVFVRESCDLVPMSCDLKPLPLPVEFACA